MQPHYFIPESKSMARQYLFEVLDQDIDLLNSDTLFQQFYAEMKEEAEGQLRAVERNLETYGKMDATFIPLLTTVDSLTEALKETYDNIEKVCDQLQITNCDSLREIYAFQLQNLQTTRLNIVTQYLTIQTGQLQDAELANNIIAPQEVPEIYSSRLNEIFVLLEEQRYQNINEYNSELLLIAQQCPYYGGEAVYRARAILELVNDTLVYDDDAECLVYGYYRKAQSEKQQDDKVKITVKPNPANEYISVTVACNENEMFSVQIINSLNQAVLNESLQCNKENIVNTKQLRQGIYTVIVKTNEGSNSYKVVIIR